MFKYEKTIPFYDVDPMHIVWHGNYIKYLEEARCAFLEDKGMTYDDMRNLGYAFPIVDLKIKYIKSCVFGQKIIVNTELVEFENFVVFKYEIVDAQTKQRLCKAETRQMCVEIATKETQFEVPQIIMERFMK